MNWLTSQHSLAKSLLRHPLVIAPSSNPVGSISLVKKLLESNTKGIFILLTVVTCSHSQLFLLTSVLPFLLVPDKNPSQAICGQGHAIQLFPQSAMTQNIAYQLFEWPV